MEIHALENWDHGPQPRGWNPRFFVSGQYEVGRAWNEEMIGPRHLLDRQTNKQTRRLSSIITIIPSIVGADVGQEPQKIAARRQRAHRAGVETSLLAASLDPIGSHWCQAPLVPVSAPNAPWEATDQSGPRIGIGEGIVGAAIGGWIPPPARHRHHTPRPPCPFFSSVVGCRRHGVNRIGSGRMPVVNCSHVPCSSFHLFLLP